jgi:hypothetical protein
MHGCEVIEADLKRRDLSKVIMIHLSCTDTTAVMAATAAFGRSVVGHEPRIAACSLVDTTVQDMSNIVRWRRRKHTVTTTAAVVESPRPATLAPATTLAPSLSAVDVQEHTFLSICNHSLPLQR